VEVDAFGFTTASYGTDLGSSTKRAGYAVKHHRDGYNVLYGDWHTAWYGDPQQRILWFGESINGTTGASGIYNRLSMNSFNSLSNSDYTPFEHGIDHVRDRYTSLAVWHMLDTGAGVDAGAQ
jgi:uncharacterized protein with NRDE domain